MKKNVKITLLAALPLLGAVTYSTVSKNNITQVSNQSCPVSGNPVNGVDTYTHEGKQYNLCSEGCKVPLSENPEKYTTSFKE